MGKTSKDNEAEQLEFIPSRPHVSRSDVAHLMQVFAEVRGCRVPDWLEPKQTQKLWATPLRQMALMCNGDIERTEHFVRLATEHMLSGRLTINSPKSIQKVFESKVMDAEREAKDNPQVVYDESDSGFYV